MTSEKMLKTPNLSPIIMIISRQEFMKNKSKYLRKIKEGAIFIYPTDTVYGIGCDATSTKAVNKLRKLKDKNVMPVSVIAPNKKWILDNCVAKEEMLERLPGPYTLILDIKKPRCVSTAVPMGRNTLGVRIPSHWISDIVETLDIPIVTTSANATGQDVMQRITDLPRDLLHVDFIIYEGEHRGVASDLINLSSKPMVPRRTSR